MSGSTRVVSVTLREVLCPMLAPMLSVVASSSSIALVTCTGSTLFASAHSRSYSRLMRNITGIRWFSISSFRNSTNASSAPSSSPSQRLLLLGGGEVRREEEQLQLAVLFQRVGELTELLAQLLHLALLLGHLEQRATVYLGQLLHQLLLAPDDRPEKSSSPSASATRRF